MKSTILLLSLIFLVIGCDGGTYSNPSSPSANPTEWRTGSVTELGGTFNFPDIGIWLYFPEGAVPEDEVFSFQVRGFPTGIPLLPSGPVLVRLGTFDLQHINADPDNPMAFEKPVEIRFRIAESRETQIVSRGYRLNADNFWEHYTNAPILDDGITSVMNIFTPGVFGAFEAIPLHVEATVSQQMGPVPLSVGFNAIVSGGHPPYSAVWDFGDNSDPKAGMSVAHLYETPADFTATVTVMDAEGHVDVDWVYLTCYSQAGPPLIP